MRLPRPDGQTVNLANDFSGNDHSAVCFFHVLHQPVRAGSAGTALGTFSLVDGNNNVVTAVNIVAPAAVPEASTTVSLGLLLALGLGGAGRYAPPRRCPLKVIIRQR